MSLLRRIAEAGGLNPAVIPAADRADLPAASVSCLWIMAGLRTSQLRKKKVSLRKHIKKETVPGRRKRAQRVFTFGRLPMSGRVRLLKLKRAMQIQRSFL